MRRPLHIAMMGILVFGGMSVSAAEPPHTVPVIYSSDLHHPHVDPDDHFDLATLFALPELEVRALVLDCGAHQLEAPGSIPVRQMLRITGRDAPTAIGLGKPLQSPEDRGTDQSAELQGAVELILKTLRAADRPITIFATGSLRDVAAAFNREEGLFRSRVGRIYANIGNPASGRDFPDDEYNVGLDRNAYLRIMNAGLPVYWCPCFDGAVWQRGKHGTYWKFRQAEVLESAPMALQNFFIFALTKPQGVDPLAFLTAPQKPEDRTAVWNMPRYMWCTAPFFHAAGRKIYAKGDADWQALADAKANDGGKSEQPVDVFGFVPVRLKADKVQSGAVQVTFASDPKSPATVFEIHDERYEPIMTACLKHLLAGIPVTDQANPQPTPSGK
jgi:hypothetical protein